MDNRQQYNLLLGLVILKLVISFILFLINLILTLWINKVILLNDLIFRGLAILLPGFEIIRIILMLISGILTFRIKRVNRTFKMAIIITLLIGIGFNVMFLIRLFGFACFVPADSFACILFLCISFILIILQEHDNYRI